MIGFAKSAICQPGGGCRLLKREEADPEHADPYLKDFDFLDDRRMIPFIKDDL